jgi:hypothetical protein
VEFCIEGAVTSLSFLIDVVIAWEFEQAILRTPRYYEQSSPSLRQCLFRARTQGTSKLARTSPLRFEVT